jgi:RND superfamily putative drug exporter
VCKYLGGSGTPVQAALGSAGRAVLFAAMLGHRVGKARQRRSRSLDVSRPGFWTRRASGVQRHQAPTAIVAVAAMLVIASPLLHMRLGWSDACNDPASQTPNRPTS